MQQITIAAIMHYRRFHYRVPACLLVAVVLVPLRAETKRPLNHRDYDGWKSISSQRISNDGKFLAYGLFPQEGDGEVVIRNLVTGSEQRVPAGARPAPPLRTNAEEGPPPEARAVSIAFSSDSRTLVFSAFPSKADVEKARKEKKTGDHAPKDAMIILDLGSGKFTRIERVKRFEMPEKASGYLAYWKEAAEPPPAADTKPVPAGDQQGGRGPRPGGDGGGARRAETGTDLMLRNLRDSSERTLPDVVEFTLAEDGRMLVYAVGARDSAKNGVFAATPGASAGPVPLLQGKGKYARLTWDEKQTQLLFLSDRDDAAAKQPRWKLYRWDRRSATAAELASAGTPGFRQGYVISDKGTLAFSKDGSRVFLACAPPAPEKNEDADPSNEDKASVDLWSYKDDYINPIQKVRAERERNRTFTAAYSIADDRMVQLGDSEIAEVTPSEAPQWVLGTDDRSYRSLADYDERFSDAYLIDGASGARTLIAKKSRGGLTWSPQGRYLLHFDGRDWNSISVPEGRNVNLTAKLPVKFFNEESDTPGTPGPYGTAGWTADGASVLLYDKHDIWRVAPDGSSAKNATNGYGRLHHLRLRYVRLETDPRERWIDPAKPALLQAEDLETWDTGFFRSALDGADPQRLLMANKYFTAPVKAKDADVFLLAGQSFSEYPDLLTTDSSFKELRKVSNANPQQSGINWGTSEVVHYRNMDGVALTAALYKPENFDPAKKYPLMVYIYEKLTDRVNRYVEPRPGHSINITYYVSNGYLVLTPDIVYTTGYPGQSALKCVLPAIQSLVDRSIVDEKAIGIQGHSWGGYQIAYMVTQTTRFRAAAAGAPVANMISAYDGIRWGSGLPRQFQYERTQSRIGGSIWQYPTRFIENSPIFWADRVQTPVMILHNDADDAVPWYQGIELYLALRRLGKEVYLFVYNGEPHGLRRRPDQKDYTIRLQQYFDHYLKGAPAPDWMEKGVPYIEKEKTALSALESAQQP